MSLINSASEWNSVEKPRKRIPSMRKTIKKPKKEEDEEEEFEKEDMLSFTNEMKNIEEMTNVSNERNSRVNDLLNQMNTAREDEGSKMGDFAPLLPPKMQSKKDIQSVEYSKEYNPTVSTYLEASNKYKTRSTDYNPDDSETHKLSDYSNSYKPAKVTPYYAKMGITSSIGSPGDSVGTPNNDKLMERINYMVHLLEAQQHEKTDNITEEFILYTFLGVFVIFIVDSFSKTGKYTR
jgi:hypothetical protein|tara:strand:+ start:46 stop:753 length:708 start_codon:yes stop_codon:yes gene_type:complete